MSITLTPEQEAWFKAHAASGGFASIEEAARQLIDDRIAELAAEEDDDLAWAKPLVDEARAGKPLVKVMPLDAPAGGQIRRLGFMAGQIATPDDFDRMGGGEIEQVFGGEE